MATLVRYDPFSDMLSLRNAMNQLFEQSFVHPLGVTSSSQMTFVPMDVYETEQGYHVNLLLPGVKPEDIELTVQQNTLMIKGHFAPSVAQDKQVNWLVHEIGTGSFERSITLPKAIENDKVETSYQDGILTITLPFSEVSRPKKISITGSQPKQVTVEAGKY